MEFSAIVFNLRLALAAPLLYAFRTSPARADLEADVDRWMDLSREDGWFWRPDRLTRTRQILYLLAYERPFRSLFYFRTDKAGGVSHLVAALLRPLFKPEHACNLFCDSIGPGFYIAHGHSVGISRGVTFGARCRINQMVTIGWDAGGGAPQIGDDVTIFVGAVLIGGITIGEGSVIAANAVVTKDVPPHHVARGIPATNHPLRRSVTPTGG